MFDLNTGMIVESEKDFLELRNKFSEWRKLFPMFVHDVRTVENVVENHIQNYSKELVEYRRTHQTRYLENAQKEIDSINNVLCQIEKIQLMSLLSR